MGIALFSAANLIESLQGVIGWLAPRDQRAASAHNAPPAVWHRPARSRGRSGHAVPHAGHMTPGGGFVSLGSDHAAAPLLPCPTAPRQAARSLRAQRPLRVVRVMDASTSSTLVGRMVISGRMADVCAELDRLAALEAGTSSALAMG
ncbi:hypothetical protein RD110_16050 [Rhodoferax koreense]|uniref:Uncharacterized protein n=1 Tax=Rhodoferax koreensis TaxID=1842727 RepID=A0A1P8JXQ3_9BURK|nr:hypothetical protein [Rhodoferax koreense]APW38526.1 hypothetical protein RD110_16050 [Rhodoferax koreense]